MGLDSVKTLLHIGCGKQGIEALPHLDFEREWRQVRVDIDPDVEPDIVANMTNMAVIDGGSVDIVYSKHNLEHLEFHEIPLALREFHRVLKPTGFLICRCPDLARIAERLATVDLEETLGVASMDDGTRFEVALIDMIFGARTEIADGHGFMRHRTGFTSESLTRHLKRAGFEGVHVYREPKRMELKCTARKVEKGNLFQDVKRALAAAE
jgi:predicted SAM-dependent methyltransferase